MSPSSREQDMLSQVKLLIETVKKLFRERGEFEFSKEPVVTKRAIIEYNGRMRADGMEKFNNPTFVSFINYYLDAKSLEKSSALGALIIYVEQDYICQLLRRLKYPPVNDEDNKAMCDACGALCNIIAGAFKSELVAGGYKELEMSPFSSYRNTAANGVPFSFKEWDKYEIIFDIDNAKRMVIEMTMGPIPKGQ